MLDLYEALNELGDTLTVRVTAKAADNRIKIEELPDGERLVRVYVTAVAENGKANKQVIKMLAKAMRLPPTAFSITHGLTNKNKTIQINRR